MLPESLRFHFRAHPEYFQQSRWVNIPGSKEAALLRSLSFRVQKKDESALRWAMVVPKKVGNAVQRAKIKRWLRHAIVDLSHSSQFDFALPYNVIIFVRKPIQSIDEARTILSEFLKTLSA